MRPKRIIKGALIEITWLDPTSGYREIGEAAPKPTEDLAVLKAVGYFDQSDGRTLRIHPEEPVEGKDGKTQYNSILWGSIESLRIVRE
jgi:hypothetical protein